METFDPESERRLLRLMGWQSDDDEDLVSEQLFPAYCVLSTSTIVPFSHIKDDGIDIAFSEAEFKSVKV